jgi:hypothetical protein
LGGLDLKCLGKVAEGESLEAVRIRIPEILEIHLEVEL